MAEKGETFYGKQDHASVRRASYDRVSATIRYNPVFLRQQKPYVRAFWLGGLFGGHVMELEQRRFGATMTPVQYMGAADLISGYLAHCLVSAGLLDAPTNLSPDDPRLQYENFLRSSGFALPGDPPGARRHLADWESGWHGCCPALPLRITHR